MAGDTFICENCGNPLGIKLIRDHRVDIHPLRLGTISRIAIHRTETKEVEYCIMIKCEKCGGSLSINSKGVLECPTCSSIKRSLLLESVTLNSLTYYRVLKSENVITARILSKEDVESLNKRGIHVTIEGGV